MNKQVDCSFCGKERGGGLTCLGLANLNNVSSLGLGAVPGCLVPGPGLTGEVIGGVDRI